jgi:hypothetical protein
MSIGILLPEKLLQSFAARTLGAPNLVSYVTRIKCGLVGCGGAPLQVARHVQ